MRPGTILVMSSLLWGSGCGASLQHPADVTTARWELAEVTEGGRVEVLDFCETRLECEERAQDLNVEADKPFALVTSEEVVP